MFDAIKDTLGGESGDCMRVRSEEGQGSEVGVIK